MRRWEQVGLGILLATTAAVYAQVVEFGFSGTDDPMYVAENPLVRAGLTAEGFVYAFEGHFGNWTPLTWLSWMANQDLAGGFPGGFHLGNLLFHLLGTALLHLALRRLTGCPGRSLFAAGLFALHPLHVESVAWIAERKDVLSGVFWMLVLWAWAAYAERPGPRRYAWVLLTFALGLACKPMLVTLPFVLLLLDFWPLRRWNPEARNLRSAGKLALEKLPLLALSVAIGVVTLRIHIGEGAVGDLSLPVRAANAALAYVAYLRDSVWPAGLAFYYPHPQESVSLLHGAAAGVLLLVITAACLSQWRRAPYLIVGWLWFVGALLPVIGLNDQARADRYTYLPGIGLYLIAAWGPADLLRRSAWRDRILPPLAGVILVACALLSWGQLAHWRTAEAIYMRALSVNPGNVRLLYDLGTLMMQHQKYGEAEVHLLRVLEQSPDHFEAHLNLGSTLLARGNLVEARSHYERLVVLRPELPLAHHTVGLVALRQWKSDEAIEHFSRALRLDPELFAARAGLADALHKAGRPDEAIEELRTLLEQQPEHPDAVRLLEQLEGTQTLKKKT